MSLPGLGLEQPDDGQAVVYNSDPNAQSQTTQYELNKETEWRFEVALGRSIRVKVSSGTAALHGTELVPSKQYTFPQTKAAIHTFTGCTLEVTSDYGALSMCLTSEYIAEETSQSEYFNIHLALSEMRKQSQQKGKPGPRVLIVGPSNSGKTSLVKTLTGYGARSGVSPVIINLDPGEGLLTVPGTISCSVFKSLVEVEEGWGTAPINGPNGEIPVKVPLVYYFGNYDPTSSERDNEVYKKQITRLGLSMQGKMAVDIDVKYSGCLIDTPGSIVGPKASQAGYDLVSHIVSEFDVNGIVCLGSERLYSDMVRKFDKTPLRGNSSAGKFQTSDAEVISVVRATKSGGVTERDATWMRAVRDSQVREYFYGNRKIGANITLQPRQQQIDFDSLTIWRRIAGQGVGLSMNGTIGRGEDDDFLPGDLDQDDHVQPLGASVPLPSSQIFERLTQPVPALRNCVLAVMNCEREPEPLVEQGVLRDSACMGFLYVTDVDEARRRISLLSPVAGRVPDRALIWSEGVDGILNLT